MLSESHNRLDSSPSPILSEEINNHCRSDVDLTSQKNPPIYTMHPAKHFYNGINMNDHGHSECVYMFILCIFTSSMSC